MKYMLLIYGDENAITPDDRQQCYHESAAYARQLAGNGQYIAANPLQSVATATSVRLRDGQKVVTDGPFAETHEQLGGYFLVDASDLDEAINIASKIPGAKWGTIEVRPIVDLGELLPEDEKNS